MQSPIKGLGSGETSDEEEEEEEEEQEEKQEEEQQQQQEEEEELPLREQDDADAGAGIAPASASTPATAGDAALLISFRSEESSLSTISSEAAPAVGTEPAAGGLQAAGGDGDDEDGDDEASSLAKQSEEVGGVAGDDVAWLVIPGGFSVKKCLDGQKHDAQTIQRWMGVRRPSKGIQGDTRGLRV